MSEQRSPIDDAIDRAVREIMRREAPAGLRGRVVSRLERPGRRPATWPRFAAAAAAVAAAVLAVLTMRPSPQAPAPPQSATATRVMRDAPLAAVTPPPPPGPVSPPTRRPVPELRMPVRTATFGPRDGRVAAASLDAATAAPTVPARATATESQSAASPPPIVIEALVPPAPIEIPPIVVAPIQLTRIQPSPATPPR